MVNEMRLVFFAVAVTLMFLTSAANATGGAMTIATVPVVPDFVNGPFGVAVDSAGNLYIANEYGGSYILKVSTATGAMAIVAGYPGLLTPMGVAVDSAGNVYIADNELNLIAEVPAAGGFITVAGCGSDSYCAPSEQPSLGWWWGSRLALPPMLQVISTTSLSLPLAHIHLSPRWTSMERS